jgi:hypothetical protein
VHSLFLALLQNVSHLNLSLHTIALENLTILANNCLLFCTSVCAEVSEMSSRLTSDTRIYADKAKDLNRQVIHVHNAYAALTYTLLS